jgi:hypothetical protein
MKNVTNYVVFFVLLFTFSVLAQTTLTVTEGDATLDGVIGQNEYTGTSLLTTLGVTLYAMDDGYYFYLAATWPDATESIAKKQWFYDGSTWTQSENEDRFGIIFDMGLNDPEGPSCATMCHGDGLMRTNYGFVDVWHWKAYRSNPMGVADDKRWEMDGRHSDPGTSSYSDNGPVSDLPEFMAVGDPGANEDFIVESASLSSFDPNNVMSSTFAEATAFDQGATFSNGDVIPGYVLRTADGDRGNVMAAGKWDNGMWTVEFKRVNSGSDYDFAVPSGGTVDFTHEIFDNTGGGHPNDGFDATVYTLDFSGIVGVEDAGQLPQNYTLDQNYPNPFNPSTTITYAVPQNSFISLRVFDILGNEVQTLVDETKSAGTYTVSFDAASVPSGVYFYSLEAGNFVSTKKMLLLK